MKRAISIFVLTFLGILFMHLATGLTDFHIDYSISKYVGMSAESSIAFLIANSLVSYLIWQELKTKNINKTQRTLLVLIIICLIGLSICPIGLYDYVLPEPIILDRTPISFLHVIFSRAMFILMAVFSAYTFYLGDFKKKYKRLITNTSLAFMIYAIFCIACFTFFPSTFWGLNIILESLYILGFFTVLLVF